ncbi:MAG: hypothetical protein H0V78_09615 [Burkholderiales bacterium]|nr:hypothetical protein [Burkholderiales bacterium]
MKNYRGNFLLSAMLIATMVAGGGAYALFLTSDKAAPSLRKPVADSNSALPDSANRTAHARQGAVRSYDVFEFGALDPGQAVVVRRLNASEEVAGGARTPKTSHRAFLFNRGGREEVAVKRLTDFSTSFGINDLSEVVGAFNGDRSLKPFRWTRRHGDQELPTLPGDTGGSALAINGQGEAAGYSTGANGIKAVWWTRAGAIKALPGLDGATTTEGSAINNRGDIAGKSGSAGRIRAVFWPTKSGILDLGALPADTESEATALNNNRDVVGISSGANGARAVLWPAGGVLQNLGVLAEGNDSRARDVNSSREIVGLSNSASGSRAFIWTAAAGMQDLNTMIAVPGLVLTEALGITDRGQILAVGQDASEEAAGHGHATGEHSHTDELPIRVILLTPSR